MKEDFNRTTVECKYATTTTNSFGEITLIELQ